MGYETRVHVVKVHSFTRNPAYTDRPWSGEEIASLDLCKIGDGPLDDLFTKGRREQRKIREDGGQLFGLWPRTPDRQQEAVVELRGHGHKELAGAIEDGFVTTDKYGDPLGVNKIDDVLEAARAEAALATKRGEPLYRRITLLMDVLHAIKQQFQYESRTGELVVVTYGH